MPTHGATTTFIGAYIYNVQYVQYILMVDPPCLLPGVGFQRSEIKELVTDSVSTAGVLTATGIGTGPEQNLGTATGHPLRGAGRERRVIIDTYTCTCMVIRSPKLN